VRTDWHGRGVGYVLMKRLIEVARKWKIRELVGDVLRENGPMLAMCCEFGFTLWRDLADSMVVRVGKRLDQV